MVSESYGTMALSESAMRSRTPAGSRVESSRSLTSSSRRWLSIWCSSSACWRWSRPRFSALTRAWAAYAGEDRQRHLVVGVEPVPALRRHDDHALDDVLVDHRDEEHRLGLVRAPTTMPRASPAASPRRTGSAVGGDPAGQALADRDPQRGRVGVVVPRNVPSNAIGSHIPVAVVHPVDADRVVVDEALVSDTMAAAIAATSWSRLSRLASSAIERQPLGQGPARLGEPGAADGRRHVVAERSGEGHSSRVQAYGSR